MPRTTVQNNTAKTHSREKRRRTHTSSKPYNVQRELDEYHAMVDWIGKTPIKPFSAGEEQRQLRRKELGG